MIGRLLTFSPLYMLLALATAQGERVAVLLTSSDTRNFLEPCGCRQSGLVLASSLTGGVVSRVQADTLPTVLGEAARALRLKGVAASVFNRGGAVPPRDVSRESEILGLVARGYRDKDIARLLFISANTVKTHVKHIRDKLEVSSRHAAARVYWETNGPRGGKITRNK